MLSAERAAVLSHIEADRLPLPGAGHDGQERMPLSRGQDAHQDGPLGELLAEANEIAARL